MHISSFPEHLSASPTARSKDNKPVFSQIRERDNMKGNEWKALVWFNFIQTWEQNTRAVCSKGALGSVCALCLLSTASLCWQCGAAGTIMLRSWRRSRSQTSKLFRKNEGLKSMFDYPFFLLLINMHVIFLGSDFLYRLFFKRGSCISLSAALVFFTTPAVRSEECLSSAGLLLCHVQVHGNLILDCLVFLKFLLPHLPLLPQPWPWNQGQMRKKKL